MSRVPIHDHSNIHQGGKIHAATGITGVDLTSGSGGSGGGGSGATGATGAAGAAGAAGNIGPPGPPGQDGEAGSPGPPGPTGPTGATGAAGALVFLEAHTASSSAQLDFTTFISSTYDTYKFELVNLIPASDNVNLYMRVGYGGGPTYDTGGYSYAAFRWSNTGSAVAGATPGSPAAQWDLAGNGGVDNGANYGVWGSLSLFDPASAIYKKIAGNIGYVDNAGSPLATSITGQWASATAMTAVRFYFASGSIASGLIRVYGVSKS